MNKVPFIDLSRQHKPLLGDMRRALGRILESQRFILSENVKALEEAVQKKTGARYAFGLASGTDALYLSLTALGIGPGDEVITTPFTFFATAGAIHRAGAKPVFCDIDDTFNIDASLLEKRITSKTKAILPVHLFGLPADMDAILKIAKKAGLAVIEDAAQSFGARYKGRETGAIGDTGCYSFYPTKNLGGGGDGGMLVTSSDKIADHVRLMRDHGSRKKYFHEIVGFNSRLDEFQAAMLLIKLKKIDEWNKKRAANARKLNEGLKDLPIKTPAIPADRDHIFHLYTIQTQRRDELSRYLAKEGIGNGVYYPLGLHLQPCFEFLGHRKGAFPMTERACDMVLSLPMYAELKDDEIRRVVKAARSFFGAKT